MSKKLKIERVKCNDNSYTLYRPDLDEHYHSVFGSINESMHIFINAGFRFLSPEKSEINLFEVGFGSGLNAILTCAESIKHNIITSYWSVEPVVLDQELISSLNFNKHLDDSMQKQVSDIYAASWNKEVRINDFFELKKIELKIEDVVLPDEYFDLVYFDAFAPDVQPELWSEKIFSKLYGAMKTGGVLVTYSCKGLVKRNLKIAGFTIKKLPGPKGKREFLFAQKTY